MRLTICLTAAAVCIACSTVAGAQPMASPAAAPMPAPTGFQLNETSWTFTDKDGTRVRESIDSKGTFIANAVSGKHLDHGVSMVKAGKACFTSAMTKDGEICWTTKPVAIGQSMDTTSDKGEKLTVTRIAYVPMSMPK